MITTDLLSDLKSIVSEEQLIDRKNTSHPLGNSGQVTVYPKSEDEIANVLKYANDNGKKIAVVAGGTKRGFGGLTESVDILLSLAKYKGIVEHTVGDMTLTVKAGTPFKELQEYLAEHNQKVSLDPAWPEYATVGGIIASNESGPKRLGYGASRDVVIGLRMVYPDGSVNRSGGKVVKNVAGYDMNKLFIGSMGTLGVVSEVTVKLRPLAKYESLVLLSFPEGDVEKIRAFATKLLDSVMEPTSLELLSPSLAERMTGQNQYTLAISFEDVENSVHYQEEFVKNIQPLHTNMVIFQQKEAQAFWDKFYTIGPNGAVLAEGSEIEAAMKIGVINFDVLKVIKECQSLVDSGRLAIEAHGGLGHGLCQVNLKGSAEEIESAINHLRNSVAQLGGYSIVTHLPFSLRQKINVWGEKPSHFFLLEGIKAKIDPNRVLNNKRFVGGI
ncbi:FAD-binding oxidoreductase [Bacillus sp. V59.32b]|uniref:FAD-binding oxidoreductase n=1 Tax=Bacillus sp. V59.32b TaxID=1758642 RepID=UPI000E3EE2C7|nr:FAD-binding oxidoreductase [Bacillus sp. V59.32b]RFU64352.1 FAD-binding oxidoreductase [Bacillus sp. V59.32b]